MQFDLNRVALESNLPLPLSRNGAAKGQTIAVPAGLNESQSLYERFGRINRETERHEKILTNLSDRYDAGLVQGSYRRSINIRSSDPHLDILVNFPFNADANIPLTAHALFPESNNAWDMLESLAGTIDGPPDWSSQLDHYLYGTSKHD